MNEYFQMVNVINYLSTESRNQPTLTELAKIANLSPYHFQRKFKQWVGVSPKTFLQCLNLESAKPGLLQGRSVLAATLESGLSSPGRLHDLCVKLEAATPGEIKNQGKGLEISYGFGPTPFGECILANTQRGICYIAFVNSDNHDEAINDLSGNWPAATLYNYQQQAIDIIKKVFSPVRDMENGFLNAYVRGTQFQVLVWRALLKIPQGSLISYGELARIIKKSGAARAVGSAVAANPLAYLIPCHRVIRNSGVIGNYRWGRNRKKSIIAYETARYATG